MEISFTPEVSSPPEISIYLQIFLNFSISSSNWILPAIKPKLKKHTELTGNEISFDPDVGTIMIFPSFVYHGTPQNFSNEERLNIVFNYSIKGEMGDNYFDKQVIK